jgi:ATP-dependent DNA helicase RecQ
MKSYASVVDDSERWHLELIAELKTALADATAPADRLALIRTIAWLSDGFLNLAALDVLLGSAEIAELTRFGLARAPGDAIRLVVSELDEIAPGLDAALQFDRRSRRVFRPATADAVLLRCSGHMAYQSETQKAAVRALITMPPGGALMVSMPTGSGKSLLFQLGPRFWRETNAHACTVVITPTIALADDHERTLKKLPGLQQSRSLTGDVRPADREEILFAFRRGEIPVLLMSPETAFGSARDALIEAARPAEAKLGLPARLGAVFIDEAHIVETWGRTFRPDFQRLPSLFGTLRAANPELRTVLLSATLSPAARQVLRDAYGGERWLEIHAGAPRYDSDLVVRRFHDATQRHRTLLRAIDLVPRPAVVYTTRIDQATDLHRELSARGYRRLAVFTGDTRGAERKRIVADWAAGRLDLVVANAAFGLGVDKSNVRSVLHACLPESAARWYQEIGRAARDGHQGLGLTLWTEGCEDDDAGDSFSMAVGDWLTRVTAEERWAALREQAKTAWSGADRLLTVALDAAPPRLSRHTGELNRRWNRSLLNLMQRSGTLRVEEVEDEGTSPVWSFILADDRLLKDGQEAAEAWQQIFVTRNTEQGVATAEHNRYLALMRGSARRSDCLLIAAFKLIEPDIWDVPPCGRCPVCRRKGVEPPSVLRSQGLYAGWPCDGRERPSLSGGVLIRPEQPALQGNLQPLLERLVKAGVEQFIVPDGEGARTAAIIAETPARLGFVLEHHDWLQGRWRSADVSTAALLADNGLEPALWFQRTREFLRERPGRLLLLVADPARLVRGRRLDQIASPVGTYSETQLDQFAPDAAVRHPALP